MTKYIFVENGKINGCGEVQRAEVEVKNIEITDEIYNNYLSDHERYIYKSGKIIQNPEYEKQTEKRVINEKISSITSKLEELDKKRIRAICEQSIKDEQLGQTWLEYYNEEAQILRNQIAELSKSLPE